jgi:hypothetical protein
MGILRRTILLMLTLLLLSSAALVVSAKGPALQSDGAVHLQNAYVHIAVSERGTLTMGTTGGDPYVTGDENKPLLFGFPTPPLYSFASLRILTGAKTIDHRLYELPTALGPQVQGDAIVTAWETEGVRVTQTIGFFVNPYSGRPDMAHIRYTVRNISAGALQAGVRSLLDTQIGDNDYAPFFIPGLGTTNREASFEGNALPDYFKAYESPTYSEEALRGMGFVRGFGLSAPDRLAICTWKATRGGGVGIFDTTWDYAITPGTELGDSSVAYWWNPRTLEPGAEFTVSTAYGLAGPAGGTATLDAPASVGCSTEPFAVTLRVTNTSLEVLRNGTATISLPDGASLADGHGATVSIGDLDPGQSADVIWQVRITTLNAGNIVLTANVGFDNLPAPMTATTTVERPACHPPTPTPTVPYMPPPESTPTATTTPTATPTPPPDIPEPGSMLLLLGGLGALGAWVRKNRKR